MLKQTLLLILFSLLVACERQSVPNNEPRQKEIALTMDSTRDEHTIQAHYDAFDTTVEVVFTETPHSISECQKQNYETFIRKQNELTPKIVKAIFEYYKEAYSDYKDGAEIFKELHPDAHTTEEEVEELLPTPTTAENLKKYYTPLSIYIQSAKDCVDGTIGIAFTCSWDVKSELGVRIDNWDHIQVGIQDIAYLY